MALCDEFQYVKERKHIIERHSQLSLENIIWAESEPTSFVKFTLMQLK